jgi:alpha-N-arabinofuranosidase
MAVVNPTQSAQELNLSISGVGLRDNGRRWRLTGPTIDAVAGLSRHEVQVVETAVSVAPKTLQVVPISVDVYQFELR